MERESFDELGMSEVFAAERSDFGRLSLRWRVSSFDELRMSGLRGRMMGWLGTLKTSGRPLAPR